MPYATNPMEKDMTQFRKKPIVIEAFTFDEFVAHGKEEYRKRGTPLTHNMPWNFTFRGHGITHEDDNCYLIPTLEGVMQFTRGDMLIVGVKGEIYPCKKDIFEQTYDREWLPHQQRVIDEHAELAERLAKLGAFMLGDFFKGLPDAERARMEAQHTHMVGYRAALAGRIAAF
jgi:hypothetical protein